MAVLIGSEAVASGLLSHNDLRTRYTRIFPDVYAPKCAPLTLENRTRAAWLWSSRLGIISDAAASALHGARWVDSDAPIELNWPNHRAPPGIITRNDTLLDDEIARVHGLNVTSVERTAYDLARRGTVGTALARLDALARATHFKASDVEDLAGRHPHVKGCRRVSQILDLVDPGAESPQETRLRLFLTDKGFPRPTTQIPVLGLDGYPRYFLDMGWEDIKVAVEYDGEHHRKDRKAYRKDIVRLEYIQSVGWIVVRVVVGDLPAMIETRVKRARALRLP